GAAEPSTGRKEWRVACGVWRAVRSTRRNDRAFCGRHLATHHSPLATGSAPQLAGQGLDVAGDLVVLGRQLLDAPHPVQHRGVVTPAEAPADVRIAARRVLLAQVHGDLPRPG